MNNAAAPSTTQVAEQLRDIQLELIDLLDRAKELLRTAPSITRERAESYWLAHARMAITKNHSYLGGSMVDMDDTIAEMEGADGEDDESLSKRSAANKTGGAQAFMQAFKAASD